MKAKNSIRYDLITRDSLRGVIRKALRQVQQHDLPNDHHFYITFKTGAKGVMIASWLQQKYPDVMTIVLQHQFSELKVTDTAFSVRLLFNHVPETLTVPFSAILAFYDPSVEFALQFDKLAEENPNQFLQQTESGVGDGSMTPQEYERVAAEAREVDDNQLTDDDDDTDTKVIALDSFRQRGSA